MDIVSCVSTWFFSSFFLLCEHGLWDLSLPQEWSLRPLRRKRGVLTTERPADSLSSVAFLWLIILLCTMYIIFCLYTHQLMDGSWFFFFLQLSSIWICVLFLQIEFFSVLFASLIIRLTIFCFVNVNFAMSFCLYTCYLFSPSTGRSFLVLSFISWDFLSLVK